MRVRGAHAPVPPPAGQGLGFRGHGLCHQGAADKLETCLQTLSGSTTAVLYLSTDIEQWTFCGLDSNFDLTSGSCPRPWQKRCWCCRARIMGPGFLCMRVLPNTRLNSAMALCSLPGISSGQSRSQ